MASRQALSPTDRRIVASWAADCAERALPCFEADSPGDDRPRALIERARAFARGELGAGEGIRRRFEGGVPLTEVRSAAGRSAVQAAGQAAAVCHMGAHALGAAAYAARARSLAGPERTGAVDDEIDWQAAHMSDAVRAALRSLPPVGQDRSGPLGPGLLASGQLGAIIAELQGRLGPAAPG